MLPGGVFLNVGIGSEPVMCLYVYTKTAGFLRIHIPAYISYAGGGEAECSGVHGCTPFPKFLIFWCSSVCPPPLNGDFFCLCTPSRTPLCSYDFLGSFAELCEIVSVGKLRLCEKFEK